MTDTFGELGESEAAESRMDGLSRVMERFKELDRAEFPTLVHKMMAQQVAAFDQLLSEALTDPARVDGQLRAEGFVWTADRLVELFGECWWERLPRD